jgi:dTDP-4-amino-4,6-dideoxygalactose transaminase
LDRQECFAYLGSKPGAFPHSERAAAETLALPIYPELTETQLGAVVAGVAEYVRSS